MWMASSRTLKSGYRLPLTATASTNLLSWFSFSYFTHEPSSPCSSANDSSFVPTPPILIPNSIHCRPKQTTSVAGSLSFMGDSDSEGGSNSFSPFFIGAGDLLSKRGLSSDPFDLSVPSTEETSSQSTPFASPSTTSPSHLKAPLSKPRIQLPPSPTELSCASTSSSSCASGLSFPATPVSAAFCLVKQDLGYFNQPPSGFGSLDGARMALVKLRELHEGEEVNW